jgi:predicted ATP-binding protein involved in virulence
MTFELRLKDIELQNFRLFDKVKITFDEKLTVFISENGAGKTALLEGIAKALTVVTERLARDETNLNNKGIYLSEDIKNETATSTTDLNLSSKVHTNRLNILSNSNLDNMMIGWQVRFNRKSLVVKVEQKSNSLDSVAQKIDDALSAKEPVSLPVIAYYPCERLIISSKNGQEDNYGMDIFNAYDHSLDGLSLNYQRFLDWYDWQERIERINKNNNVLDIVKEAILAILNDPEDTSFKNIYIDPSQFKNPRLIIQKGADKVEVNQLSSGEKSLLMLVSNLAYRMALLNPNAKNPLKEGQGIVLIDEIDLHLHPRWQYQILPKLIKMFPNIQFIVSTHSMLVVSNISDQQGQIYKIENTKIKEAFGIYGKDLNHLIDNMGVPSRNLDIQNELSKCRQLIEDDNLTEAKISLTHLESILANERDMNPDPEILYLKSLLFMAE